MLARQPDDTPPVDVVRNDSEAREKKLREALEARLDPAGRVLLAEYTAFFHGEIAQRDTMLREELRIEDERCKNCRHLTT